MKTLSLLVLVATVLAGCSGSEPSHEDDAAAIGDGRVGASEADARIECATGGKTQLGRACTVDKVKAPEGLVLVLRASDGGFRRLLVTSDGRGVIAADGSQSATVTPIDKEWIDVSIDGDRYRLPATVKGTG